MEFHVRRINMPMSLNRTEHMYIITVRLHMMIYMRCYAYMYTYACISRTFEKLVYEYS